MASSAGFRFAVMILAADQGELLAGLEAVEDKAIPVSTGSGSSNVSSTQSHSRQARAE